MTVKYRIVRHERTEPKTASVRAQHGQAMSFDKLCERTSQRVKLATKDVVKMIVEAALDEAYYVATNFGFRVDIGDKRLSLYVQAKKTVAAGTDPDTGETVWPADRDMRPQGCDGSLKCEVHKSWNQQLREEVEWELTDDDHHIIRVR